MVPWRPRDLSSLYFSGNENLQPTHPINRHQTGSWQCHKEQFLKCFPNAPRSCVLDATHLDECDHVAQGFVHLLQSAFPLLGRRAIVVAFHINALVVHSSHLGTAIAGGEGRGRSEKLMHIGTSWLPALLSSSVHRTAKHHFLLPACAFLPTVAWLGLLFMPRVSWVCLRFPSEMPGRNRHVQAQAGLSALYYLFKLWRWLFN